MLKEIGGVIRVLCEANERLPDLYDCRFEALDPKAVGGSRFTAEASNVSNFEFWGAENVSLNRRESVLGVYGLGSPVKCLISERAITQVKCG